MKMLNKVLAKKRLKPFNGRSRLRAYSHSLFAAGITSIVLLGVEGHAASNSNLYTAAPPFVAESIGKPNVVIALDISGSMKQNAYYDTSGSGNWKNKIQSDYDPNAEYFGYFETGSKYSYDYNIEKRFFVEDNESGVWSGNFLNWATMRRMDVVRKVLVGGKVRDRDGETLAGESPWYVIEGQNEPADYEFKKSYSASSSVSPFPDDSVLLISEGKISAISSATSQSLALSDKLEIGVVTTSRDKRDDLGSLDDGDWVSVEYINSYSSAPSVVASSLSYNGSDPSHARVRNVTTSGFEVRLEEWDYRDVNHTTEDITYIVADNTAGHKIEVDGSGYEVYAGVISTDVTTGSTPNFYSQTVAASGYTPVVFTGVSTQNDSQPVVTRIRNVGSSGFEVALQNEDEYYDDEGSHPTSEDIHWIAIQPVSGILDYSGTAIEIGSTGNTVDENFEDVSFTNSDFLEDNEPIIGINMQTFNGSDTAFARYQNPSNTGFEVKIEEEKSYDDEVAHADESVGYIAVDSSAGFNIKLGVRTEPEGIIQQNSGSLRFGVAVYNYDHSRDPTSVYTGNTVDGGTLWPCYPDVSLEPDDRTNFDICLETHVKAPLSNILDVIEDHPLIWGSTPIAETLYDIKGYFGQIDFSSSRSHEQWYDNGTEGLVGTADDGHAYDRPSYEVSNDWDPYYYDDFENRVPCAKSFVLHFNDGAPYKDFQNMSDLSSPHPTIADDGVGNYGTNEVLDDLALELRSVDCRDESGSAANNTGTDGFAQMTGHQEIVSYYVYAALGVNEDLNNSTRRMREAAVNGGFVDSDGDNEPDPNHNIDGTYSNINDYISAGVCPETEWDSDGDCNPDTFYFANDGAELVDELNAAFESIVTRAATGGASAVVSASQSGEGNIVNAIFRPSVSSGSDTVTWIGDVHALMVDSGGNIRQDNGDRVLGTTVQDPYLDMCTDEDEQLVRVKTSTDVATRPTSAQTTACSGTVFPLDLFDVDYLWSASEWLSALTDTEVTTQRSYTSTGDGRYIITGIDSDSSGIVQASEVVSFEGTNFPEAYAGLLADDYDDAQNVLTYIRGKDIDGYRSRQLDGETMRLGDVIYSIPTSVGRPAENLDLLYQSESYAKFFDRYKNRRQVIYSGANDGMLHAFNGGWYDSDTKTFKNAQGSDPGSATNYDLGAELWAYVPYNLLPHLEYLTESTYGSISSDHLYFVDLEPRVFDAKIFPRTGSDADAEKYPGLTGDTYGWGTVLVVGMRLGGGETTVDANLSSGTTDNRTLRSSIMIFDVTDPDDPPRLLLEFTHPDLGFTTSMPAPITVGTDSDGNGDWYLLIGSGPDTDREGFTDVESTQNAKLFLLDLIDVAKQESTVLETSFGTSGIATLSEANSFVSEITPVDFGLDNFTTDAVYFGTVSGSDDTAWDGNLYRMKIQANTGETSLGVSSWTPELILDANAPITAAITPTTDSNRNKWLFFGTGRLFTTADNLDDSTQNYFFGVKEPRDTSGSFTYNSIATASIVDVTDVEVSAADGTISSAPSALTNGDEVSVVEKQMQQYSTSAHYLSGWKRTLDTSERNFGAATALGGTLTFTTFVPDVLECSIEGDAYLYALNALTGTAGEDPILEQDDSATVNAFVVNIGGSPATTPSLHRGEGYDTDNGTTAILQSANGNIISIEQDNEGKARDGETSWRQLR